VALELEFLRKVSAASAVFRDKPDDIQNFRGPILRHVMHGVPALTRFRQPADRILNRFHLGGFAGERNCHAQPRQINQPASPLRNTVVGGVQYAMLSQVSEVLQLPAESPEPFVVRQPRDVFHHHGTRPESLHEPFELQQQVVSWVINHESPVQGPHRGETLARRAPRQEIESAFLQSERVEQFLRIKFSDVLFP